MIRFYKFINDLVYEVLDGKEIWIPDKRYDGTRIFTPKNYKVFYIDENGIKHIKQFNPLWQKLECDWDDEIIYDPLIKKWRVLTPKEKLNKLKQIKINELKKFTYNYIISKYPIWKQTSDLHDIQTISTKLVGLFNEQITTDDIRDAVYDALSGLKTFDQILIDLGKKADIVITDPDTGAVKYDNTKISEDQLNEIMNLARKLLEISKRIYWKDQVRQKENKYEDYILNKISTMEELEKFEISPALYETP